MVDERPEETEPPPDQGRAKREPPTIDLKASEVSTEPPAGEAEETTAETGDQSTPAPKRSPGGAIAAFMTAMISGAGAAALVVVGAWYLGWTSLGPGAPPASQVSAAPQFNAAAIDDLTSRVAKLENTGVPSASETDKPDAARIETLEKSIEALRGEIAGLQASSGKSADASADDKVAHVDAVPAPDLSPINDRIAKLEQAVQAQGAEITQQGVKAADASAADAKAAAARAADLKAAAAKPADDIPLRRAMVASLLDISVRQGDPYAETLAAAKSLALDADALKPLDGFASSGVPTANGLSRELLTLVPKLSPRGGGKPNRRRRYHRPPARPARPVWFESSARMPSATIAALLSPE